MDNEDEPVEDRSAEVPIQSPSSPHPPERDEGHSQRLSRMRFVQVLVEDEEEGQDDGPIVEEPSVVFDLEPNHQEAMDDDNVSSSSSSNERSTNSSENGLDDSDADRLFDDYIYNREQQQLTAAEIYNTELPTEHAYLGKLERVEGVDYLEPGKVYRLPICSHHSIVFPGEIVPMILNVATLNCDDPSDGVKFGLVFRTTFPDNFFYGVTCQVFERGDHDANGSIVVKTIALQRFHTVRHLPGRRADVLILPEILLPDPLLSSCSNLMKRHAVSNKKEYSHRFKSFLSHAMVWPKFVYDQYGTEEVLSKVDRYLAFLKITSVPSDPVKLSFWLARNVPIDERDRKLIYQADAVISRMLVINKSLDHMCYFICKRCEHEIASYNDIFAMSKQGVQTSYCNPSGYVHETLTIYKTKDNSTFTVDRPSTEFSWFPGYSWQITLCANCRQHLGWKFVATKKNYLPASFYGLSGNSIKVKSVGETAAGAASDGNESDGQSQGRPRRVSGEHSSDSENGFGVVYEVIDMDVVEEGREILANAAEPPIELGEMADAEEEEDDADRFQDARE
ncbi:protein cereblon-like isoform X2 [Topomyia yanbarensis]|uniref:protein cereblon-like isoform X2 n=1 Tax=Topomyia yanbarensis TaxID=2498891 RepID=UPI00273BF33B|nr:protein cereblon-like isoform X2 [Topomyia yanbarensis]